MTGAPPIGADRRLGIGLVGAGRHSEQYLVPALTASRSARLAGVCDADAARAEDLGRRIGVSWTPRLDQLLDNPAVEALVVASPNHLHEAHCLAAFERGMPVLCEKPLASTSDAARRIAGRVPRSAVLAIGFHLRHNPVHRRVAQLIGDGAVGALAHIEIRYAHALEPVESAALELGRPPNPPTAPRWRRDPALAGGGQFVGTGVHAVDLARRLAGEITSVAAVVDDAWRITGVETVAAVAGTLASGGILTIVAGKLTCPDNGITIHGATGSMTVAGSIGNAGGGTISLRGRRATVENHPACDPYVLEIDDFAAAVAGATQTGADGYDGVRAVEITEAVYRSVAERRAVPTPAVPVKGVQL
jgi:predicted dehydrogenase